MGARARLLRERLLPGLYLLALHQPAQGHRLRRRRAGATESTRRSRLGRRLRLRDRSVRSEREAASGARKKTPPASQRVAEGVRIELLKEWIIGVRRFVAKAA